MRISIDQVNATLFYVFEEVLGHVEPCRSSADNSKSEVFIGLDVILTFKLLSVLLIVVVCAIERRIVFVGIFRHFTYSRCFT